MGEITPVAIALVVYDGCYLVGRRGPDTLLAGYYEFPGGKCQAGETPEACVVRECREETGLEIEVDRLRSQVTHTYPYGTVRLYFFDCRLAPGSNHRQVSASFAWVPRQKLAEYEFPAPNHTLIAELLRE